MKKTVQEFRAFLLKQNAVALAIGVIIGAALGRVVSGLVEDVIMPIVALALPAGEWRTAQIGVVKYGDLAGRIVDFVIVEGGNPRRRRVRPRSPRGNRASLHPRIPRGDLPLVLRPARHHFHPIHFCRAA